MKTECPVCKRTIWKSCLEIHKFGLTHWLVFESYGLNSRNDRYLEYDRKDRDARFDICQNCGCAVT